MTNYAKTADILGETLTLNFTDQGEGRNFLLFHGGAGLASVAGFGALLAQSNRVVIPTHPGFNGTPRPEWFLSIADLATAYCALIDLLQLSNVTVVGNSVGGWIAAEMALRNSPRIVGAVLLNAVGIDTGSEAKSILNPLEIDPADRAKYAFFDQTFAIAPSTPEAMAMMRSNFETLDVYAGHPFMHHLAFRQRLAGMAKPVLVAWGEEDRIVDLEYGRRYAESIPNSTFKPIAEAGHFPQIEKPQIVLSLINEFLQGLPG
jgi:pimeloyl-ACP methyl ester carboxylesterase